MSRWEPGLKAALRRYALPQPLAELEPGLRVQDSNALFVDEGCVDPRHLTAAAIAAAQASRHRLLVRRRCSGRRSGRWQGLGVRTGKTQIAAGMVVNCAGAWAGQIGPHRFPTRPVKGHMLCVAMPENEVVRHVVRTPDVYLIPRSDGRMVIGATVEEAGFDKRTLPETIQKLRRAAVGLVPGLADARVLETGRGCVRERPTGCRFWARRRRRGSLWRPDIFGWNFAGAGDGSGDGKVMTAGRERRSTYERLLTHVSNSLGWD